MVTPKENRAIEERQLADQTVLENLLTPFDVVAAELPAEDAVALLATALLGGNRVLRLGN